MDFRKLLTPRWIITTLLVIAVVVVMARLGLWQLDRLAERRAFNSRVLAQANAPELALNEALRSQTVATADLTNMEYRPVQVTGVYDPQNEVIVRNQAYGGQPGYHLLTPLRIDGTGQVVLINRGFIPFDQSAPAARAQYAISGPVTVRGILKNPFTPRYFAAPDPTLAPGQTRLDAWNYVNIQQMQPQISGSLLPVYIEASAPDGADTRLAEGQPAPSGTRYPVPSPDQPDLSEGSHMGYAIQWFSFAAILAAGYPFFVKKQLEGRRGQAEKKVGLGANDYVK